VGSDPRSAFAAALDGVRPHGSDPISTFGRLGVTEAAQYAAESTALQESDFAHALGTKVEELESRVGRLERGTLTRVRGAARRGLRR